jgi:hypothetical protein
MVSYLLEKEPVRINILRSGGSLLSVTTSYTFGNMEARKNGITLNSDKVL